MRCAAEILPRLWLQDEVPGFRDAVSGVEPLKRANRTRSGASFLTRRSPGRSGAGPRALRRTNARRPYPGMTGKFVTLSKHTAKCIWLHALRLDGPTPFGSGPEATRAAIQHLGYVQIDTINVIERCHHHIL